MTPLPERSDAGLERLVNAVLVPGLCDAAVPEWLGREIDAGLGAVCWFGGAALPELRRRFSGSLVLSDEEGGNVTRLEAADGSSWPGNAALGLLDDVAVTERVAAGIGAMARRAGIDVVLAPVVDVNSEPDNPVIGVRSFGDDPALVARHGAAFVRGVQSQGVAACAKHFPGHGATRVDSHVGLPVVDIDRSTFLARDVAPFAASIDGGVRCLLTAHVSVPAVDATPATMSARWIELVRGELGFDGVVISDALDMHAISRGVGRGRGAVNALQAGVDMICIGNPCFPEPYDGESVFAEVRRAIVAAVETRTLQISRLEEAAGRIHELSTWVRTQQAARGTTDDVADTDVAQARSLGRDVAARTVQVVGVVPLERPPCVIVEQRSDVAAGRRLSPIVAAIAGLAPGTTAAVVGTAAEATAALTATSGVPIVLVTDGLNGTSVLRAVRRARPDTIVVHVGPRPGSGSRIDPPVVFALGDGAANAAAVADLVVAGS